MLSKILRKIESFYVGDSFDQEFQLYVGTKIPNVQIDSGDIKFFKTDESSVYDDIDGITAFLYEKDIRFDKMHNSHVYALFKTEQDYEFVNNNLRYKDNLKLHGVLMFRYIKWLQLSLPIGFIVAQHTPKLDLKNTPFKFNQCNYHFTYKDLGRYRAEYQEFTIQELIESYNQELNKTNDKYREVRLIALYLVFKQRFDNNPITLNKNGKMILGSKIFYSNSLNTIINIQEN